MTCDMYQKHQLYRLSMMQKWLKVQTKLETASNCVSLDPLSVFDFLEKIANMITAALFLFKIQACLISLTEKGSKSFLSQSRVLSKVNLSKSLLPASLFSALSNGNTAALIVQASAITGYALLVLIASITTKQSHRSCRTFFINVIGVVTTEVQPEGIRMYSFSKRYSLFCVNRHCA